MLIGAPGVNVWSPTGGRYVAILTPTAGSVFSTGVTGTIGGVVFPPETPVDLYDSNANALLGSATVVGCYWQFLWSSTPADYGVTRIDARTAFSVSSSLQIAVVTWPHTLFGALNFWYGWLGFRTGTGPDALRLLQLNSYGTLAEPVFQAVPSYAPNVASDPAFSGGRQYVDYGTANNHSFWLRTAGAVTSPQPFTLLWHGIRTGPTGTGKIVIDGEDSVSRCYLASSAANNWSFYAGTVVNSLAPTNAIDQTVFCFGSGAASRIDWLDAADTWTVGPNANAGTNGMRGCTTNRYTVPGSPSGMGNKCLCWGVLPGDISTDQRLQFTRWRRHLLSGAPFCSGSGAWLCTPAGRPLTTPLGRPLTLE